MLPSQCAEESSPWLQQFPRYYADLSRKTTNAQVELPSKYDEFRVRCAARVELRVGTGRRRGTADAERDRRRGTRRGAGDCELRRSLYALGQCDGKYENGIIQNAVVKLDARDAHGIHRALSAGVA